MNILCFGDSNTHGFNPKNGTRFDKNTRYTGILQQLLGENFNIIEEGLSGRTTVFDDPITYGLSGIRYIEPCLMSHEPLDLVIVMLGTNDTKERFSANSNVIALGLTKLLQKIQSTSIAFEKNTPNILVVCPAPIRKEIYKNPALRTMGYGCSEKSYELAPLYEDVCHNLGCHFLDAGKFVSTSDDDFVHLDENSHKILAKALQKTILEILAIKS